jgi:hypothetical protein
MAFRARAPSASPGRFRRLGELLAPFRRGSDHPSSGSSFLNFVRQPHDVATPWRNFAPVV